MAVILVDYENTGSCNGLRGVEYLMPHDELHIFYSNCSKNIRNDYLTSILQSKCRVEIHRLQAQGKNALDFYIAAQTGECFAEPNVTEVSIVSNDKGYKAVADFWRSKNNAEKHVIHLVGSVEEGLMKTADKDGEKRREVIRSKAQLLDMEKQFALYKEQQRIRALIEQGYANTEYAGKTGEILDLIHLRQPVPGRKLYTEALHRFGMKAGCEIYRILKTLCPAADS